MAFITGDNNFGTAKWIVDPVAGQGTHTTIQGAISSASSGQTIFIRPATYTEDLTLKPGVNLTAYEGDGLTPTVTIIGKTTATSGIITLSGLRLQTNSDFCLLVSGSDATILNLLTCYFNCTNHSGISYTNSNGSSVVNINNCFSEMGTTGIALYNSSSPGLLQFDNVSLGNSAVSTTPSTSSSGPVNISDSVMAFPLSASSTSVISIYSSIIACAGSICVTTSGTGATHAFHTCIFVSGGASSISLGAGTNAFCTNSIFQCGAGNGNVIVGTGSLFSSALTYNSGFNIGINPSVTQSGGAIQGSYVTPPTAGFLGESMVSSSNPSLTSTVAANFGNITLTPGIWDISCMCNVIATTGTSATVGISPTSASFAGSTQGDMYGNMIVAYGQISLGIPSFRVTLTTPTTYYGVVAATFVSGGSAFGRISATRVG